MLVKQVVAVMLVSSLICNAVDKPCSVKRVKPNSIKQALKLIREYDRAKNDSEKQCKEQAMNDLLVKLTEQNKIFGGAMKDEEMSGELEASIVNEQEQVDLKRTIKLLKDKLASINGQKTSSLKKMPQEAESKKEYTSLKRKRSTN